VWFDSGVSHDAVIATRGLGKPAACIWKAPTSIAAGSIQLAAHRHRDARRAPYRQVLTHGFTVDEHGRKMSKSLGNVVAPQKVIDQLGADVLRLWVASTDYRNEMSGLRRNPQARADAYRRIRNTARFLLGNLDGFDPAQHLVPNEGLLALDRWAVQRALELQRRCCGIRALRLPRDRAALSNFCTVDLGSLYLDVTKDRLYTMREDRGRRSAQSAMYPHPRSFRALAGADPSFTADEIWPPARQARRIGALCDLVRGARCGVAGRALG
jgi:isoleucyl-tRNA synthetase